MSDLDRRLRETATRIDWPEGDLSGEVTARLREERPRVVPRWAPVVAAAAAVALLLVGTPQGRQAVADILEVGGIQIGWGEVDTTAELEALDLGEPVNVEAAVRMVPFEVLAPTALRDPDGVFFAGFPPGGAVHMVWTGDGALPAAGDTGIGLLYSQFRGGGPLFLKTVSPDTEVDQVEVRGQQGFWIEGAPHLLFYSDPAGEERSRLAANVLAWTESGVTHRIETSLGLELTLDLAESLEPAG